MKNLILLLITSTLVNSLFAEIVTFDRSTPFYDEYDKYFNQSKAVKFWTQTSNNNKIKFIFSVQKDTAPVFKIMTDEKLEELEVISCKVKLKSVVLDYKTVRGDMRYSIRSEIKQEEEAEVVFYKGHLKSTELEFRNARLKDQVSNNNITYVDSELKCSAKRKLPSYLDQLDYFRNHNVYNDKQYNEKVAEALLLKKNPNSGSDGYCPECQVDREIDMGYDY